MKLGRLFNLLAGLQYLALVAAGILLALPVPGNAGDAAGGSFRMLARGAPAGLATPGDFIEFATANDVNIHELVFASVLYQGTETCMICHEEEALDVLDMGHFKWEGRSENIIGLEGGTFGKNQLLNNFCIAVPTNEPRCTQCHAGYGYKDAGFTFLDPSTVDCLVCHDHTGTYAKHPKTAGAPDPSVDLNAVARSVSRNDKPQRRNCLNCHAKAGGGDNVKHGDLSTDLIATTREFDVHMGVDGANLVCADCHAANHDPKTGEVNHGIAGLSLHSVHEGEMRQCKDCHGSRDAIHAGLQVAELFATGWHNRLACQTCHIPAIARARPTKTEWYWADAGQDISPVPTDPDTGMPAYDKMKGSFNWELNYRPTLRYANGKWERKVIGVNDGYDSEPIVMGAPVGSHADPEAMIYPFKLMKGNQPVDTVNKTILVPHLFGTAGGPNPYWGKWDWNLALIDGANRTGQAYSGTYGFASTEMLLSVNHEIAPAENALGYGSAPDNCLDCHVSEHVDWPALGWTDDPLSGGSRVMGMGVAAPSHGAGVPGTPAATRVKDSFDF